MPLRFSARSYGVDRRARSRTRTTEARTPPRHETPGSDHRAVAPDYTAPTGEVADTRFVGFRRQAARVTD